MEPKPETNAEALRVLMRDHGLTQRRVADLCFVSRKTVESWLSKPCAPAHRAMPDRALSTLRLQLKE